MTFDVSLNRWKPCTPEQYLGVLHELCLEAAAEGWDHPFMHVQDSDADGQWFAFLLRPTGGADPEAWEPVLLTLHTETEQQPGSLKKKSDLRSVRCFRRTPTP